MSAVLAMAKQAGKIDGAVVDELQERLSKKTVGEINTNRFALAQELGDMPGAFDAAGELLNFMRDAELIGLPSATTPAAPAQPPVVNVLMPTRREDMNLGDLLKELVDKPEDAAEILPLIEQQATVREADYKLRGSGEWVILTDSGALDVTETLDYVRHLATPHTQPQRKWKNKHWPTTLGRALGQDQRIMLYPFATTQQEVLLVGPDKFGNDWTKLSDTVHEAIIDAVSKRTLVVGNETEARRISHELFADELPVYLQEIVEEYEQAKQRGHKVERYATPDQLRAAGLSADTGSRRPFGGEPERDDAWYRAQLEEECGRAIHVTSGTDYASRRIVESVQVNSGSAHLDQVIVLGDIRVNSGTITGTAWNPRTATIRCSSGTMSQNIQPLKWKKLYEKAVELGIITG